MLVCLCFKALLPTFSTSLFLFSNSLFSIFFVQSGEAEAILAKAQATAKGIAMVSQSLKEQGGVEVRSFISLGCTYWWFWIVIFSISLSIHSQIPQAL